MGDFFKAASDIVGINYAKQAEEACNSGENKIKELLTHRVIPKEPMDEVTIRTLMDRIAQMDSNNFAQNAGLGEREGRIFSTLVSQSNWALGHGIGRSGDVNAL